MINITDPLPGEKAAGLYSTAKGRKLPQYTAALAASLSALSTGTVLAWTSQISPKLLDGELGFPINHDQLGWIGSLISLGAAVLSLLVGPICDLIGRKTTMLLMILPMISGWSLLIWATNVEMVYAGRFLTGMVAGASCVTAPLYANEISQKEIRGALGCYTQLMISFGILFDVVVSKFVSITAFTVCCGIIPIVFGIVFVFMPESPVYHLKKGDEEKARASLVRLRGKEFDVETEILDIKGSLKEEGDGSIVDVLMESFKKPATKRAFIICVGLMSFRIFCGIDAITAYTSYIFQTINPDFDPQLGTIILITLQTAASVCQSMVVDRVGRRILLLTSETAMAICICVVGVVFLLKDRDIIEEEYFVYVNYMPLAALCIFYVGYSLGLGPIAFMMNAEILPQEVKSIVASFSTFISWMLAFTVTKTFLMMREGWGADATFFFFGGLSFVGSAFIFFLIPETKGKTADEIQKLLGNR